MSTSAHLRLKEQILAAVCALTMLCAAGCAPAAKHRAQMHALSRQADADMRKGKPALAQKAMKRAAAADPNDWLVATMVLDFWASHNRTELAEQAAARILASASRYTEPSKLTPRQASVLALYAASALDTLGSSTKALAAYEKSLALDPDNPEAANALAWTLALRNSQLPRALSLARRSVQDDPERSERLDTLGWVYFKLGRYGEARQWLQQAVQGDPDKGEYRERLAEINFRQGDVPAAYVEVRKALSRDPHDRKALSLLRRVRKTYRPPWPL